MKNARINTDQRLNLSLKAGGASIDMTSIDVLSLYMYCNPQKARDGAIKHSVSTSDAKVLEMIWPADVQRYLGSHSVHGTIRYAGAVASFDVPAVNVVSLTSEADISTEPIVLEASVGTEDLTATITIQGIGPQGPKGPKGDKMTYADLTQEDKKDLYEGASEVMKPLLATKQNTLTDTDGGYGQRVANLEKTKQETLTAGNGISIEGNEIGVTTITESESQPNSSLWINPSEDTETDVTYNRSQIDAMLGAKQDALQLTVKDNGNIVLSNIQGQSKEFMPATPSGDPMHYAYVAAGAEYNDTGTDIIKTTPWADLADDDADKTVVHKAGHWYLNGLGDITSEDIRNIYVTSANVLQFADIHEVFSFEYNCRTYFPSKVNFLKGGYVPSNIGAAFTGSRAVSIDISNRRVNNVYKFITSSTIQYIISKITLNNGTKISDAFKNSYLKYVKIDELNSSIIFNSSYLYTKCILYMIENEAATSAITITLHPDAYARAMANADIVAALEAHPNVSLASA